MSERGYGKASWMEVWLFLSGILVAGGGPLLFPDLPLVTWVIPGMSLAGYAGLMRNRRRK